jgi:hypothetical protein
MQQVGDPLHLLVHLWVLSRKAYPHTRSAWLCTCCSTLDILSTTHQIHHQIISESLVHLGLGDQRIYIAWQLKALAKLMGMHYKNLYKKGQQNRVANALFRVPHAPIHDILGIFVIQP